MICGVKLRKLRRKAAEALEETKENLLATPCKRAKLDVRGDMSVLRSGRRRKVFGLTLTDSRLGSETLTHDLCANTDLTQFQSPNMTQFLSPASNTYQNFSLNESSHIYNELMFDTKNASVSLDSDQCTFDESNDRTLVADRRDITMVSSICSSTRLSCRSGTPDQSTCSDKTFMAWTQPHPGAQPRCLRNNLTRSEGDGSPASDITPTSPSTYRKKLCRAKTLTSSTPLNLPSAASRINSQRNFGQKKLKFTDSFNSTKNVRFHDTVEVNETTLNVTPASDFTQESSIASEIDSTNVSQTTQSSVSQSSMSQSSVLGLGQTMSESSLTRIRRKAFRSLQQSRGEAPQSGQRSDPEGDSARPLHPSLVGVPAGSTHPSLSLGKSRLLEKEDTSDSSSVETSEGGVKNRGQLKLSLSISEGTLTVYVMEAKNLQSKWNQNCTAYIQTTLIPDEKQSTIKKTSAVSETNQPSFQEKITYELNAEDQKKRVMVSCWSKDSTKNCGEFLGCMSFGLKHMMKNKKNNKDNNKEKEGWYYLLSENIGHRKHLEVTGSESEQLINKQNCRNEERVDVMAKLDGMDDLSIVIHRGYLGYGFTVKGTQPVRVGRVKECGAAEDAGLVDGDYILRINGVDVTRATTELVAEMIRTSAVQVSVDIRRKPQPIYESIVSHGNDSTTSATGRDNNQNYVPTYENLAFQREEGNHGDIYMPWQPHLSMIKEESAVNTPENLSSTSKCKRKSYSKWTPDISDISGLSPSKYTQSSISQLNSTTTTIRDFTISATSGLLGEETRHGERFSSEDDASSISGSSIRDLTMRLSVPRSSSTPSINSRGTGSSSSSSNVSSYSWFSRSDASDSTFGEPNDRESAIQKLLSCEESFARRMHRGIQKFSRPLRHKILNVHQHSVLFQNLEKLVAMSDFTLRQLLEKSYSAESSYIDTTDDVIVDLIGSVYRSRVKLLCEAYESYHKGLGKAYAMLGELNKGEDFSKFARKAENKTRLSLSEFLERPAKHLSNLATYTARVLRYTFPEHEDHRDLRYVVDALKSASKRIQGASNLRKSRLQGSTLSMTSSMVSMTTTSSVTSSVSESLRSASRSQNLIDPELVAIQNRMTFAKDVEPFPLLAPSRHLVYAGELEFVISEDQTIPLWVVLCSDLMLLTTKDEDGNLVVVDDPLFLQETVHYNFNCQNAAEYVVVVQNETVQRAFRLRSDSLEQKWAWKNILEPRIRACQLGEPIAAMTELARM